MSDHACPEEWAIWAFGASSAIQIRCLRTQYFTER